MKRYQSFKEETIHPDSIEDLYSLIQESLEGKSGAMITIGSIYQMYARGKYKIQFKNNSIVIKVEQGRDTSIIELKSTDLHQMTITKTNSNITIWHDKYLMNTAFMF